MTDQTDTELPVPAYTHVANAELRELLFEVHQRAENLAADQCAEYEDDPEGWHQLAIVKAALEDAAAVLRSASGSVEPVLAKAMPFDTMEHDVLRCPVTRGWSRPGKQWDSALVVDQVAARVADEAAVDPETGEVRPVGEIVRAAAHAVAECGGLMVASASWRTTKLKQRGIDPSRYYTSDQPARQTISMPGRTAKRVL